MGAVAVGAINEYGITDVLLCVNAVSTEVFINACYRLLRRKFFKAKALTIKKKNDRPLKR